MPVNQSNINELYWSEDLTSDIDDEVLEEYNRVFSENWDSLVNSINNLMDKERAKDVVQYTYIKLLHRNPEQVDTNLKNWIYKSVATTATKYVQRGRHAKEQGLGFQSEGEGNLLDREVHGFEDGDDDEYDSMAISEHFAPEAPSEPDERLLRAEQKEQKANLLAALEDTISGLSDTLESITRLYILEDRTAAEVADELGFAKRTIYSKATQARNKIRERLASKLKS